jgi:hypothetical protein
MLSKNKFGQNIHSTTSFSFHLTLDQFQYHAIHGDVHFGFGSNKYNLFKFLSKDIILKKETKTDNYTYQSDMFFKQHI